MLPIIARYAIVGGAFLLSGYLAVGMNKKPNIKKKSTKVPLPDKEKLDSNIPRQIKEEVVVEPTKLDSNIPRQIKEEVVVEPTKEEVSLKT